MSLDRTFPAGVLERSERLESQVHRDLIFLIMQSALKPWFDDFLMASFDLFYDILVYYIF